MKRIINIILLSIFFLCFTSCEKKPIIEDKYKPYYQDTLKVYFINVGQADCTLVKLPNKETLLIDCGLDHATCFDSSVNFPSWNNIKKVFDLEMVKKIDYFIITHNHSDHYYYAVDILKKYQVEKVYMSGSTSTNYTYRNILNELNRQNIDTFIVRVGTKIIDLDHLTLQVVSTQEIDNPSDANFTSVATKLTYDQKSFMFTGDMGHRANDGEKIALDSNIDLKSDVLKVGHHGSKYATGRQFIGQVRPAYAVITTSNYSTTGHPYQEAIDRIKLFTTNIFESRKEGTIMFETDGNSLTYKTMITEQ